MFLAKDQDWAFLVLTASAFCMGFSMPTGRLFMLAAAVLLAVDVAKHRRRLRMPATAWLWLALVALAVVVTANGLNPAKGMGKLDKLMWFMGIPVAASIVDSRGRLWQVLRALILGLAVLALRVCIRNPLNAQAISTRFEGTGVAANFRFGQELIFQGSLVDGQRLMVGLVGAVALTMGSLALARMGSRKVQVTVQGEPADGGPACRPVCFRIWIWPILIGALAVAEILVMKRGSWLSSLLLLAVLLGRRLNGKWMVLGVVVLAGLAVGVAPIRQRLTHLRTEFSVASGGRLAMWTQVAPKLLKEYPQGIGFRAMSNDLMRKIAPRIERNRDHLHSNFVEMAVSLGWAGLALYLVWMGCLLRDGIGSDAAPRPIFWMILALFINGFVEYNFADGEIVILMGLLGGLAAAGRRLARSPAV
jgi:hypothetical protein